MQSGQQSTSSAAQPMDECAAMTVQRAASSQPISRITVTSQARSSTSTTVRQRSDSFRRPLIVGKRSYVSVAGDSSNNSRGSNISVTAAKPYKSVYFIDNVSTSVDSESLTSFVSSLGVRVLSCFEVKPRMTARQRERHAQVSHKTFRLCINRADNNILLNADFWPSDVSVFRWCFKRSTEPVAQAGGRNASLREGLGSVADDHYQPRDVIDMDATIVNYLGYTSADETSTDTVTLRS